MFAKNLCFVVTYCGLITNIVISEMEEFTIDVNDILNVNLMPAAFFMLEAPINKTDSWDNKYKNVSRSTGSFDNAISAMGFHRKMMKQYMCSNFLAGQILSDVAPTPLEHRIGIAEGKNTSKKKSRSIKRDIQDVMRYDQGSSGYKNWLAKTATMDDIYQHINPSSPNGPNLTNKNSGKNSETSRRHDKPAEDYEEGDVTGYAMQQPIQPNPNFLNGFVPQDAYPFEIAKDQILNHQSIAGSKSVFPDFHGTGLDYAFPNYPLNDYQIYQHTSDEHNFDSNSIQPSTSDDSKDSSSNTKSKGFFGKILGFKDKLKKKGQQLLLGEDYGGHQQSQHSSHDDDKGSSKEMGLKDLFEIALTTLAFLAFGMFILQVLMCVTMTNSNTNSNMIMMPIDQMDVEVVEEEGEGKRTKRATVPSVVVQMNELSKKVLLSINALIAAEKDNGKCLHQIICENNKEFRDKPDGRKIWMPIWNLGMSWLSSKIIKTQHSATSIFEGLKASALGLGKAQCKIMFPCNLKK